MEAVDWQTAIPVGMAIAIFLGGMLMMFSNFGADSIQKKERNK